MPSVLNELETPNTLTAASNNSVLGAAVSPPSPPEMRSIGDAKAIRTNIYNRVLDGVNNIGPLSNSRHTLQLSNVRYVDPADIPITKQKDAILTGKSLHRRLKGTWTLSDNATGKDLDAREMTVAQVPYFSPRGTFTLNGTEYGLSNQLRLRPGIFTRVKENGELESHVNVMPGNGFSHRYFLDPESGIFKISIGQAKLPLYPVLRAIGVPDSRLKEAWGNDLHAANVTTADNKTVNKLYQRLVRKTDPAANDEQKSKAVADVLLAMKLDPEVTKRTLGTPYENLSTDAILDTTKKLIRVSRQEEDADDRDHMAYQTLHGPEDLLSERITKDKAFLRNLLYKVSFKGNLSRLQPGVLTRQLHAVIMNSGLGNPLEEVNKSEMLDNLHRLTRLGVGGIENEDTVPEDSRSVHPSQAMFIDAVKTPESSRAGIDTRLSWSTKKGSDGKLYAEVLNPKSGKLEYKSPQEIADYVVAFPGELQKNKPQVAAMVKGQTVYVPREQVQYSMPHAENWFSPLTNMIPMKSALKGQRASMGARFLSQALSLTSREAPLVQSGMPGRHMDRSFEDEYGTALGAVRADQPGFVQKVTSDGVVVKHDDGTTKEYELYNHFPFARKSYGHNEAIVRPGQRIEQDGLLAKSNFTDDNGTSALGINSRVAFIGAHGHSYEDAVAISESFAKKLTSEHMYQHTHDWSDNTKKGTKPFISLFPTAYSKEQLGSMDDNGIVKPGTVVKYGDPLVLVAEERERSHSQIHKGRKPSYSNKTITWEHHSPGVITDAAQTSSGVNVAVKAYSPMQVGDKLSNRFGGKGIVSKIIPDDQMFHDKEGTPYDIAMNPLGMISRINPSQIIEMALGKIAAKTGKPYKVEDFSNIEDLSEFARQEMKKHGLDFTDTIHDPTTGKDIPGVNTGMQYLLKLHHTSESKAQGLGLGAYSNEEVPARGGAGDNPKKIALLETNALLSHGACFLGDANVLTEDGCLEIQHIVKGRMAIKVACVDITTNEVVFRDVVDWLCRCVPDEDILRIEVDVAIPGNHNIFPIKCTRGHNFYTPAGKIQAEYLVVGDDVYCLDSNLNVIKAKIRYKAPYKPLYYENNLVYNITVAEHHNYIVNGVLVGNSEILRDAHLVRGQKNDAYWQAFMSGHRPPEPQVPLVYRKYVDSLKASGINVVRNGQQLHLMALTNNDVKKLTGGSEIQNTDTVDWKEGLKPRKGGFFDPALTGGHGGNKWTSIKLDEPLPNPAFEEPIRRLLNLTQKRYEGVLAGTDSLNNFGTGSEAIYNALSAINVPKAIQQARAEIAGGKKSIRDDAVRKLSYLKTLDRIDMHPKDWVLTHVPVLPPIYRPISVMAGSGNQLVSDANFLYKELFDANQVLKDSKEANIGDYSQERMNVYNSFKGVVGLGDPIQPKNQERQVTGILKNVFGKGGPKFSMLQRQLMGTNTELVGRAVVSPNPDLDMDSVAIPEEKAWEVYKPFIVRRLVHKGVPRLEAARAFKDKTEMAKQSLLAEMGERPIIMTRAPALHRYNVMAHWPRLTKGSVMEVSPLIVKGYGMDFDGDESLGIVIVLLTKEKYFNIINKGDEQSDFWRLRKMSAKFDLAVHYQKGFEFFCVDLEDVPHLQEYIQKDHVKFHGVEDGIFVLAYDEKTGKVIPSEISSWSEHLDREVEIVNLKTGRQILTDDDERAVYGVDVLKYEICRNRPSESLNMFVPRVDKITEGIIDTFEGVLPLGGQQRMRQVFELNRRSGHLIGALAGDGWVTHHNGNVQAVALASINAGVNSGYADALNEVFVFPQRITHVINTQAYGKSEKLTISSRDFGRFLEPLIGCGARNKHLPPFYLSANKEFRFGLLEGLIDTDGSISVVKAKAKPKPQLMANFSSASLRLVREVQQLLRSLQVRSRITTSKTPAGEPFWMLAISAMDLQDLDLQLWHTEKKRILADAPKIDKTSNAVAGNDVIPISTELAAAITKVVSHKTDKNLYGAFGKAKTCNTVSRITAKRLLDGYTNIDHPHMELFKKLIANENVLWDKVVSYEITGIKQTGYDLTVPDSETFMNTEGIILSNTSNFHVPGTDEAKQEAIDKLLPSRNLLAASDFRAHYTPSMEYLGGLYHASTARDEKRRPHVFRNKADAKKAHAEGRIDLSTPVEIIEH